MTTVLSHIEAIFGIIRATCSGKTVAWFGGDHDDPPGWRAYLYHSDGHLVCAATPPRLTRAEAECDLPFTNWLLTEQNGCVWPRFAPPPGWPGRQYGADIEDCGPDSIFGMDIPECDAEVWAQTMMVVYGIGCKV